MKKKQTNYYKDAQNVLEELRKAYPHRDLPQHIALAMSDYSDLFSVTGKEFLFALEKYQTELALDYQQMAPEEYISKIQEDGSHLFDKQDDEWEEDEY